MNRIEKRVLWNKADVIRSELEPKELLDCLIGKFVLFETDQELIMNEVTRQGRNRVFLNRLRRKDNGYSALIECLHELHFEWIADEFEKERIKLLESGEQSDLRNMLDSEKISKQLSQVQCLELGQTIVSYFKEVGLGIGFLDSELRMMEVEYVHNHKMMGCDLLIKWGQRKTGSANFSNLLAVTEVIGIEFDEQKILLEFGRR